MKIPEALRSALDKETDGFKISDLRDISANISKKYLNNKHDGVSLVTTKEDAIAYAIARMPATYSTVYSSLKYALELIGNCSFGSMLDVGSGTGAAVWAASELLNLKEIDCIEREHEMAKLGKNLLSSTTHNIVINWLNTDIKSFIPSRKYDIVIASYSINEMCEYDRDSIIRKLWDSANKLLLIVDAGTPYAHGLQQSIRNTLLKTNACLIAPCPQGINCKLSEDDWCHFICRVERTKLHKLIKEGELTYEDEKFSYSAFCKIKPIRVCRDRIIRRPNVLPKRLILQTCMTADSKPKILCKSDGEIYKFAKRLMTGDALEIVLNE